MATEKGERMEPLDEETPDLGSRLGEGDITVLEDAEDSPREAPLAVADYGTTGAEEKRGEPLTERLRRELHDVAAGHRPVDPDKAEATGFSGRLVDGGDHAHVAEGDTGGYTAEEAAMHLQPEPQGRRSGTRHGGTAERLDVLEVQVAVLLRTVQVLVEALRELTVAEEGLPTEEPGERNSKVRRAARSAHDLLLTLRDIS